METLTAAIIAALGNLGVKAVGDAYEGMKSLVLRKFGAESDLAEAVKRLEQKPDAQGRQITLKEERVRKRSSRRRKHCWMRLKRSRAAKKLFSRSSSR